MEKRREKDHDFSVTAFRIVQEAVEQVEPKPLKALGHKGVLKRWQV